VDDDFFLDEHAPRSDRFAVVADEGDSVWLYLTRALLAEACAGARAESGGSVDAG
jgi:hypothetical protein